MTQSTTVRPPRERVRWHRTERLPADLDRFLEALRQNLVMAPAAVLSISASLDIPGAHLLDPLLTRVEALAGEAGLGHRIHVVDDRSEVHFFRQHRAV